MPTQERGITVFLDIDGTQNVAPPPLKTALSLCLGKFSVPPRNVDLKEAIPNTGIKRMWSVFFHSIRPFTKDSLLGLNLLKQTAQESNRDIVLAVISGREIELHEMTRAGLINSGRMNYFQEIHLNTVTSSSGHKEREAKTKVEEGNVVVLIEDDLRAALRVARINENHENNSVLVYLIKNLSNAKWLIKRGKVNLPENVIIVKSLQEAAYDFRKRIQENKL